MPRREFVAAAFTLLTPYWRSAERGRGVGLLAAVVALTLGAVYVSVRLNVWHSDFYNALQEKDLGAFYGLIAEFAALALAFIVLAVYKLYLTQMLQIEWRTWLTDRYLERWLGGRAYYHLELLDRGTDNPDQRIAEDLKLFVDTTLVLASGILASAATLVAFVMILWRLSGALTLSLGGIAVTVPGYLVWFALLYAAAGSWLAHVIGRPLVHLEFQHQRFEADFRFALVRLREHGEGVALYRGEPQELAGLRSRFSQVIRNWWSIMRTQKQLTWFTSAYGQFAIVFPFVVTAPRYFSGAIGLGTLVQTGLAFAQVQASLAWFVMAYPQLALWKATVDRLAGFTRALAETHDRAQRLAGERTESERAGVSVEDLALALPGGRPLLAPASLELVPGENVLLTGPSGSGKTTLFRALAGIWPYWRGRIAVPRDATLLFLPQRAYLPIGTLRRAVVYPAAAESVGDDEVRAALRAVGLALLAADLDREENWAQVLSGGEQQRLAFARALLNRPDWLFLDEATASLPETAQAELYDLLRTRLPRTTLVSIGHRESLAQFHARRLRWEAMGETG